MNEPNLFPLENSRRVKAAIPSLLGENSITFSGNNTDLVVMFDVPFNKFSAGRILLLQQIIFDRFLIEPELVRASRDEISISLGNKPKQLDDELFGFLQSQSHALFETLGIGSFLLGDRAISKRSQMSEHIKAELLTLSEVEHKELESLLLTHGFCDPDLRGFIAIARKIVGEHKSGTTDPFQRGQEERLTEEQKRDRVKQLFRDLTRPIAVPKSRTHNRPLYPPLPSLR